VLADDVAAEKSERKQPRYVRESVQRPSAAAAPEAGEIPQGLHLEISVETAPSAVQESAASRSRPPGRNPHTEAGDIVDQAVRAADWAAEEIARTRGFKQYYRVGFHRGIHVASADDSLGTWDFMDGVRFGRRDSDARTMGIEIGRQAADDAAAIPASAQVAEEFGDLHREPRFDPYPIAPAWTARGNWATAPVKSELFVKHSIVRTVRLGRQATQALVGWEWDAWRLYECNSYGQFYDSYWDDADLAFRRWKDGDRRSFIFRKRMTRDERDRFRAIFASEYSRRLPAYYERHLRKGYREGFRDGWNYGAFVTQEWHYRQGYTQGFDEGVTAAAATGFEAAYPYAFERHYRAAFTEWSENPMPGIVSVRLGDANSDGIFQPGEDVLVDYELANFGGREGTFTVILEGTAIERPEEITVSLPARSALRSDEPTALRIDPRTPARTQTEIDVRVAGDHHSVGLLVSYPLEFTREVDLDSDTLGGRAVIRVLAVNRSRKPVDATIDLDRVEGYGFGVLSRDLGVLSPGARDWAVFELTGLRPLDTVAGNVRAYFSIRSAGGVQDSLTFNFPDSASDLHNRDLLELMVAFSRDPGLSWADAEEARALMIRRLEVDWHAAVNGRGNPYKQDLKRNGSETALGELVQTYLRVRPARGSAVFDGLDRDIEGLAEDLPGTHPFLRKYMKRLARKLG
jgi:hypothetical protein